MKITKYHQACLLIETNNKRILVDPGNIGYHDDYLRQWHNIDYILITHRHADHCHLPAIKAIVARDKSQIYTTQEVVRNTGLTANVVRAGDVISLGKITVEVTRAIHGFFTPMKHNGAEIFENVGYIIDDGKTRLYVTSDTINFNHDYHCDILCMPFNGNGLTLGVIDGVMFSKEINPKLIIPVHMEHPLPFMNPDVELLKEKFAQEHLAYKFLAVGEELVAMAGIEPAIPGV